jgi:hypothetical protein
MGASVASFLSCSGLKSLSYDPFEYLRIYLCRNPTVKEVQQYIKTGIVGGLIK